MVLMLSMAQQHYTDTFSQTASQITEFQAK